MNTVNTLFAGVIMMSALTLPVFLLKSKSTKHTTGKSHPLKGVLILLMTLTTISLFQGCHDNNVPSRIKQKYVWAVGDIDSTNHGTILFSDDGGATWEKQGTNCNALLGISLSAVWAVDENTVWVIGNQDLILTTTDGGQNWTRITPPDQKSNTDLNSISIVGKDNIWISTSNGQVFHSPDGGIHWTDLQSGVLGNHFLQGIHAINNEVVYVAGNNGSSIGFIARTTDGGQTWDSIVTSPGLRHHPPIGVAATDINHVVVYGGTSQYMMTSDGGQSWINDSVPSVGGGAGADINSMKMLDSQTWWGAFDMDNIYITEDAGRTWVNQGPAPPPLNMYLLGIDYYDRDLCVIVGATAGGPPLGKIIRTTDGGQTWKLVKQLKTGFYGVSFIR